MRHLGAEFVTRICAAFRCRVRDSNMRVSSCKSLCVEFARYLGVEFVTLISACHQISVPLWFRHDICSVLQCVAMCCSVLQCFAMCCSVLQCVAVRCSVLQCVAVCCSVLQCVAVCCSVLQTPL